jgi:hypothetical protein
MELRVYVTCARTFLVFFHGIDIDQQEESKCMHNRNNEARSCKNCRGKAIRITYSHYMSVALVTHYAMRKLRITRHLWRVRFYRIFPHHQRHECGEKGIDHKKFASIFSTTSV